MGTKIEKVSVSGEVKYFAGSWEVGLSDIFGLIRSYHGKKVKITIELLEE